MAAANSLYACQWPSTERAVGYKSCWNREEKDRADFKAINVSGSLWCLDETADEDAKQKTLMIILTKPEATEDEVTWKRGLYLVIIHAWPLEHTIVWPVGKDRNQVVSLNHSKSVWYDAIMKVNKLSSCRYTINFVKVVLKYSNIWGHDWMPGQRQDNLTAKRHDSHLATGYRFFRDDEDEFGLEDILQAICFLEVKWLRNDHACCNANHARYKICHHPTFRDVLCKARAIFRYLFATLTTMIWTEIAYWLSNSIAWIWSQSFLVFYLMAELHCLL